MELHDLAYLAHLASRMRARLRDARDDERGYTIETVIITAALAALAIAVVVIIATKVTAKASSIPTG